MKKDKKDIHQSLEELDKLNESNFTEKIVRVPSDGHIPNSDKNEAFVEEEIMENKAEKSEEQSEVEDNEVMSDPTALDHLPLKKLYQFHWDCGSMGNLEGLFVATDEEIQKIIGKEIYFGKVLGRESDIRGVLAEEHIVVKSEDQDFIATLVKVMGSMTIAGYSPTDYYLAD